MRTRRIFFTLGQIDISGAERKAGEMLRDMTRKPGETDKAIISHDVILPPPKLV